MRFAIKNTLPPAEKENGIFIRFSGTGELYRQTSERAAKKIGEDPSGKNNIYQFTTGLNEDVVQYLPWFTDDEKKEVVKKIKQLRPEIEKYFGGKEVIDEKNSFFWRENTDVNTLVLRDDTQDVFFDTKNPPHALLYLSIISGAFDDIVAPTKEWAENPRTWTPHYLVLENQETFEGDVDITRSDAHGMLAELRKEADPNALFILAWCMQYDTQDYAAYTKSTPQRDLIAYHVKYIDGKLRTKRKKDTAKEFISYANRWKSSQLRPNLYAEAYLKAGEYFNYISNRDKTYKTSNGTELGHSFQEALENITKSKYAEELEILRDQVEAKWSE